MCMCHCVLTFKTVATRCSLMEKTVISSMVMMRSCTGLVLPRTAPKEIKTVAVLKSALIILQDREENKCLGKQKLQDKEKRWNSKIPRPAQFNLYHLATLQPTGQVFGLLSSY